MAVAAIHEKNRKAFWNLQLIKPRLNFSYKLEIKSLNDRNYVHEQICKVSRMLGEQQVSRKHFTKTSCMVDKDFVRRVSSI